MEQITVNLLATGVTPVCHVSQFDDNRTVRINLKKGAEVFTLSGTETVKMRIRKPDNTERVVDIVNTSSSYVDYVSTPEDCDIEGVNVCELVIDDLGSKNFLMNVEEDAYGGGAEIETLSASGSIATFETNMVDNLVELKAEITPIQDLHGYDHPWPAGGGKNLFDPESPVLVGFIGSNGFSTNNTRARTTYLSIKPNTTYTISRIAGQRFIVATATVIPENGAQQSAYVSKNTSSSITITSGNEDVYLWIFFYLYETDTLTEEEIFNSIQVETGSTATAYEPYSNICPITGHTEAKIVRTGKNLIDTAKSFQQSSNVVVIGQNNAYSNHELFLKKGTYSIRVNASVSASVYFHMGTTSTRVGATNTNLTFTLSEDKWISFYVYTSAGVSVSNIADFQLELGSTATDYEPYAGTEVTVQFGQTIYKGVLDLKNSKVIATHVIFEKAVADMNNSEDYPGWRNSSIRNIVGSGVLGNFTTIGNIGIYYAVNTLGNNDIIYLAKSQYKMTQSEWKNINPDLTVQFMIELATPIEIPLSAISQFETLLGINNVYADIGDVELKYLKQV